MGEQGRSRVQQGFTWDAVVGRTESLYQALLRP
jgi:glycosyltransferase involved in cell wall biosynthesis